MKLTAEATVLNDDKLTSSINTAQTTANDAKSIADNTNQYFWFTSSGTDTGAHISEKTQAQFIASPSGGNLIARSNGIAVRDGLDELATFGASDARIGKSNAGNVYVDTDSVDIRNGSTVLSTFTSSGAELGKNSDTASIKMCANKFGIKGSYRSTVSSNDTFVATIDNEHTGLYKLLQLQSGGWLALDDFNGHKTAEMSVGNARIIANHDETDGNSIQATVTDDSFTNEATLTIFPNRAEFSGGNFVVDGGNIKNLYGYNDTVSSKPNMYIGTTGLIHRTTYIVDNTSSKRFKHDIKDVTNPTIDPHLLYDIEVKQFRFNDDTEASRKGIDLIGFIAEQVEEVYPIAVDYDEHGQVETWREHYIIPPMLKLIQEQHEQIEALTKRIEALERKSND